VNEASSVLEGASEKWGSPFRMAGGRQALLVALLSVVLFIPALGYEFVWDDILLIQHNQFLRPDKPPTSFLTKDFTALTFGQFGGYFYRPLLALSFWLDGVLWGDNAAGFHLTNLLLHGVAVGLLWLVAQRLASARTATVAATLFAIHPAHSEVVAFISGRVDSLALIPILSAVWLALELRTRQSAWRRARAYLCLLAATALALAAKESAALLPGLLLTVGVARREDEPDGPGNRPGGTLGPVMATLAIATPYALWRAAVLTGHNYFGTALRHSSLAERGRMAVESFGYYTLQALLPLPLGPERYPAIPQSFRDLPLLLGWIALASLALWLAWAWRRCPAAATGLLWYGLALLPALHLVPPNSMGQFVLAERWLYTPSAGMALAIGASFQSLLGRRSCQVQVRPALLLWGAVALVGLLWITPVWKSNETFFRHSLARNPGRPVPLQWVGLLELEAGRPEKALELMRQAVQAAPRDAGAWMNLGWTLRKLKRYDEALAAFQESLRLNPGWIRARINMASVYYDTGRYGEGIALMQSLLRHWPTLAEGHKFLGVFYERVGRLEDAARSFREAIRLRPEDPDPFRYLARVQMRAGNAEDAVRTLREGLAALPGHPGLLTELAIAFEESGRAAQARPLWEAIAVQTTSPALSRLAQDRLAR